MTWHPPKFDKHAFAGKRSKAVSATKTRSGWDSTGISFGDLGSMHIARRERRQERRLPTPKWAVRNDWLQELIVAYLEERFYVKPNYLLTLIERLKVARAAAEYYCPQKRVLLEEWLEDYHSLCVYGRRDLTDEEAIKAFATLRCNKGQLPLNADIAREYLAQKKIHDLEIQIQNIDTDIVLTERGHAEVIAAIVYLYYRLGWDSVAVAEQLALKSPHVRQVLARLHATWNQTLSHLWPQIDEAGEDQGNRTSGVHGAGPAESLPEEPLERFFNA
ncbi:Uncharacterised protein [uncultured archaeon]|nr:Uncharacterised protein [uncultured archaeon]